MRNFRGTWLKFWKQVEQVLRGMLWGRYVVEGYIPEARKGTVDIAQ